MYVISFKWTNNTESISMYYIIEQSRDEWIFIHPVMFDRMHVKMQIYINTKKIK